MTGKVPGPDEKKVPLVSDAFIRYQGFQGEHRCEFEGTRKGRCCTEIGEVELDGLRLCERHAERLRLEERAACWRAFLAHIELWSGKARNRGRDDVLYLLEVERVRVSAALDRVLEDLEESPDGDGEDGSGDGRASSPLPPLPSSSVSG